MDVQQDVLLEGNNFLNANSIRIETQIAKKQGNRQRC
jgi:hypothetical protein